MGIDYFYLLDLYDTDDTLSFLADEMETIKQMATLYGDSDLLAALKSD